MPCEVRVSVRAKGDIDRVVTWLDRHSPTTATRWMEAFDAQLVRLETEADSFPAAEEAPDLGLDLRELNFGKKRATYRVVFTVVSDIVRVVSVRSALQDRLRLEAL